VKRFGEVGKCPASDRVVVPIPPALQSLGIIAGEAVAVLPAKTPFTGKRFELRLVEQKAAWKDVGLDEVRVGRIPFEDPVIDRDELERSAAARPEVARDAVEVGTPPSPADGFDHFDRSHCVELLGRVAIILQADFDAVRQPRFADLPFGPGLLLIGKRKADDADPALGRFHRQRAPAAADLKQALSCS